VLYDDVCVEITCVHVLQVVLPVIAETTSLGAAFAAGLAVGFWAGYDMCASLPCNCNNCGHVCAAVVLVCSSVAVWTK
jgi:glycerol kinase